MPINYKEYHPKWRLISRLIRFRRAHNKCEWCGIHNNAVVKRLKNGTFRLLSRTEWDMVYSKIRSGGYNMSGALKKLGFTKIILTVAHVDHDKTNNRFSNLAALCQRCHLKHDAKHHVANRKYGRSHKSKHQLKIDL